MPYQKLPPPPSVSCPPTARVALSPVGRVQRRGRAAPVAGVVLLPVIAEPALDLDVAVGVAVGQRGVEDVLLPHRGIVAQQVAAVGGGDDEAVELGRVVADTHPARTVVVGEGAADGDAAQALVEVEARIAEADDLRRGAVGDAGIVDDRGARQVDLVDAVGRHAALAEPELAVAVVRQREVDLADVAVVELPVLGVRRLVDDAGVVGREGRVAELVDVLEVPVAEVLTVAKAGAGIRVGVVDQPVGLAVDAVVVVQHALVDLAVEPQRRAVAELVLDRRQPLRHRRRSEQKHRQRRQQKPFRLASAAA